MAMMLVLLLLSCGVTALLGSRGHWQRPRCPACRCYNFRGATRCAYCTGNLSAC